MTIHPISRFISPDGTQGREIVVPAGRERDKYFEGELGEFARLTAKHEGKRRRATSASYSINSNAAKLQSKLHKESAAGRYDHLIDTYQDETLRKSMRHIPNQRQPQPQTNPPTPTSNQPPPRPQTLLHPTSFQEKIPPTPTPTPTDPSPASDLRTIKKRLWEFSLQKIQKAKNDRPSLPTDTNFLSAFHRMSRKEGGGEGVRVFKQIETNDMVETRVKLAKELDDRTAGWLDHSSQVMAEIEGVSKQEMEMAKYMHG